MTTCLNQPRVGNYVSPSISPSWFPSPGAQELASSPSPPAPETRTELGGRGEARTMRNSSGGKSHSCRDGQKWEEFSFYLIIWLKSSNRSIFTHLTSSRNLSSSKGDTWEYLKDRRRSSEPGEFRVLCLIEKRFVLELNSLSVPVFNLSHDGVGVNGLGFFFHTVFWK